MKKPELVEKDTRKLIDAELTSHGQFVHHHCPVPGIYGKRHVDYIGCAWGSFFAIEAKRPSGQPTKFQNVTLGKVYAAGGAVFSIDGPEGVKVLHWWLEQQRKGYHDCICTKGFRPTFYGQELPVLGQGRLAKILFVKGEGWSEDDRREIEGLAEELKQAAPLWAITAADERITREQAIQHGIKERLITMSAPYANHVFEFLDNSDNYLGGFFFSEVRLRMLDAYDGATEDTNECVMTGKIKHGWTGWAWRFSIRTTLDADADKVMREVIAGIEQRIKQAPPPTDKNMSVGLEYVGA